MRRRVQLTAALLSAGLLLAGCGDAPKKSTKATSDYPSSVELAKDIDLNAHFSYGPTSFASSWDPLDSATGGDIAFWNPVYDKLLFQTPDGDVESMLATEFTPSEDLKSMTLKLRAGLAFSDGTPFDASAVKFNLERYRGPDSKIAGEMYQIASIDVVDPLTVKINVDGALGSLAVALTSRAGMMVSPAAVQSGAIKTAPVGIGPYIATDILAGNSVNFKKTDSYWEPEVQKVATMTYKYIADDQTRYNALVAGELDSAAINPDQLATAEKDGLKVVTRPSASFLYVGLNTAKGPLGDPEVRKALNMALDREAIAQGLYDGHCTPQIQPFSESSPGYSKKLGDGLDKFPYDPEAAKKILKDKGITELEVTTNTPTVSIYTKFAEVVQSQFKDIGIKVTVQPMTPAQMVQDFSIDKGSEMTSSVFTGLNDPDALNGRYLSSKALFNPGAEDYPEMLKYAYEGADLIDPVERNAAYEKMMDAWVEKPPHIVPVCMIHLATGMQSDVSNVYQKSSGTPDLRGVAVGKR